MKIEYSISECPFGSFLLLQLNGGFVNYALLIRRVMMICLSHYSLPDQMQLLFKIIHAWSH